MRGSKIALIGVVAFLVGTLVIVGAGTALAWGPLRGMMGGASGPGGPMRGYYPGDAGTAPWGRMMGGRYGPGGMMSGSGMMRGSYGPGGITESWSGQNIQNQGQPSGAQQAVESVTASVGRLGVNGLSVLGLVVGGLIALLNRPGQLDEPALEILKRRYARGELSEAEFERARQKLA